ncbi:hypothetical protein DDB_G0287065 [Dictyostelium discoideum AX4]|uniref:Transmembrane protein n=1 Tax=Dictyostelium discoideum TaxID=44689 RepID=Q54KW3_DICDI|nr:hypothetical protein DDB_G0287065 [Dictyostelium discoideum AX4]EAL63897.1 hypothetical protein DDB_G0287065 [Dictyostelium discoideum AX4]|eukprot:XP_637407.1 hypothetical protein DDB_G0287065 [Dictyostelium discoideum AX4]
MKIFFIILILISSFLILNCKGQGCTQFLSQFKDPKKCIQISIAGVNSQSMSQEGYKGNLIFKNGLLVNNGSIINLQTYETTCTSYRKLVQPFFADQFQINDFSISFDGNIKFGGVSRKLSCLYSSEGFASFKSSYYLYSLTMRSYDSCPPLYYGEPCRQ